MSVSDFYDRQGHPLDSSDYAARASIDKRVAEMTLPDGKWISTVWLGWDHQFGNGPPLIFETMVFPSRDVLVELDSDRYSTEAEALAGHEAMVAKWSES